MRHQLFLCLLLAGPVAVSADEIDDYVTQYLHDKKVPGASVAILKGGELVKSAGYGFANLELGVSATPETIYEIGSITKPFTATLIFKLVEEGKLALEDPISKYLEDIPAAWQPVTIRRLLNHTSGIPSYTSAKPFIEIARSNFTPKQIIDLVREKPMDFEPGARWQYNNTGFYLLGLIIEKASGRKYEDLLKDQILDPLGMSHTRVGGPEPVIKNRASGYEGRLGGFVNRDPLQPTAAFSAGSLVSDVGDMIKFARAFRDRTLLTSPSYDEMLKPAKLANGESHDFGLGVGIGERGGHKFVFHGGGTPGFSTMWLQFPSDDLAIIVLTNIAGSAGDTMAKGLVGVLMPELKLANQPASVDENPEHTKEHKSVLETLLAGQEVEQFTDEFRKFMDDPSRKAMTKSLAAEGEIAEFTFLSELKPNRGRQYRVKLGEKSHRLSIFLTPEGKIAGMRIESGD
jgi:CubicO group peptidase (beta-lactamase class C family)